MKASLFLLRTDILSDHVSPTQLESLRYLGRVVQSWVKITQG